MSNQDMTSYEDQLTQLQISLEQKEELTADQIDFIADEAVSILKNVLELFGEKNSSIDEYEGEEGELILDINGGDLAVLIGRHGKTLESLQTILNSLLSSKLKCFYPITVDIEGYKSRRKNKVISLAQKAADKVLQTGRESSLPFMTPYERRIVHMALKEYPELETYSTGLDPQRRVVIKYSD